MIPIKSKKSSSLVEYWSHQRRNSEVAKERFRTWNSLWKGTGRGRCSAWMGTVEVEEDLDSFSFAVTRSLRRFSFGEVDMASRRRGVGKDDR